MVDTDPKKIHDLLTRGVEEVFVRSSLEQRLAAGTPLRVKLGIDPTSAHLHVGRAIPLRKLRDFQKLGHIPVFIVGDFTAQIGDPSDKLSKRPMLTAEQIVENLKTYKEQVAKFIDLSNAEFHFNSEWLSKLTFKDVAELAESFSVQQMTSRRNFAERLEKGEEISLRELLYPLMQGYDSVAIKADVEIGGFDQLFNVKAGRTIQRHYGMPEQDILTCQMLMGTDGRKMSASWPNTIAITDTPTDMFGKVMSVRDDLIIQYFTLCTDRTDDEIKTFSQQLAADTNPRDIKLQLAHDIVTIYHSATAADDAQRTFIETFSKGGVPDTMPEVEATADVAIADVVVAHKVLASKSAWTRLVRDNGVADVDTNAPITDIHEPVQKTRRLRIGKRAFLKIIVK
jgi:tyrosyl-tRNA synthetase